MEMWSPVNIDRSSVNDGRKLCEWLYVALFMAMWSPVNSDRSSVNDGRKLCEWQYGVL